jgi:SHS2 domain-containing protein
MGSGHRWIDHTADLCLEAWADDEPGLLAEAMRGVVLALTEGEAPGDGDARRLEIDSIDPEDRLVRWLNEILWLAIGEGFVPARARIELHDEGLHAELHGQADARALVRSEIKAATYHDLALTADPRGHRARVVLDV